MTLRFWKKKKKIEGNGSTRTGLLFWQHCLSNQKSWDTGIWNKNLKMIAEGKGEPISVECAKLMPRLQNTNSTNSVAGIKDIGEGFFLFEEDLPHHINKAIVIVTTGVPTSFFNNYHI